MGQGGHIAAMQSTGYVLLVTVPTAASVFSQSH